LAPLNNSEQLKKYEPKMAGEKRNLSMEKLGDILSLRRAVYDQLVDLLALLLFYTITEDNARAVIGQ